MLSKYGLVATLLADKSPVVTICKLTLSPCWHLRSGATCWQMHSWSLASAGWTEALPLRALPGRNAFVRPGSWGRWRRWDSMIKLPRVINDSCRGLANYVHEAQCWLNHLPAVRCKRKTWCRAAVEWRWAGCAFGRRRAPTAEWLHTGPCTMGSTWDRGMQFALRDYKTTCSLEFSLFSSGQFFWGGRLYDVIGFHWSYQGHRLRMFSTREGTCRPKAVGSTNFCWEFAITP